MAWLLAWLLLPLSAAHAGENEADAAAFFEREVRPLLADRCYECHGPDLDRVKGGLRMDGLESLLVGGDLGPSLQPGDPAGSLLIEAVRYDNHELQMPPRERLSPREVGVLERWVALNAPWPGGALGGHDADAPDAPPYDLDAARQWWSYRPVSRPAAPAVGDADWVANPIDAFVLARLEAAGLQPSPPADRRELLRRATFDLTGLPTTLAEVQAFEADTAPGAWERVLDRLLASPAYGERWGRHWLDLVRFAQTNGFERDEEKPYAWRYRDWVIDALNRDMPYDRFLTEQLAGDELPDGDDGALIATGLYRLGAWDTEPDVLEQGIYDSLDDTLRVVTEGMLGTTLGCARCHDHKFDPLPQEDYYGLLAFFSNIERYEDPPIFGRDSNMLTPLGLTVAAETEWERQRSERIRGLRQEIRDVLVAFETQLAEEAPEGTPPEELDLVDEAAVAGGGGNLSRLPKEVRREAYLLRNEIQELQQSFEGQVTWALTVRETGGPPEPMHLLLRGKPSTPGPEVQPHFIQVLCDDEAEARPGFAPPKPDSASTGRRLELARWIASADNPLTARVAVNRLWQGHFGRGLVPTPDDFGVQGELPTHPALLDWLASEFVAGGWSPKALHKLIMSSATYRMSSHAPQPTAEALDPANMLLWRQQLRRLEAEALHDSVLAVAGNLDLSPASRGGRGFFPRLSREVLAGASRPGQGWEVSGGAADPRRAVYAFVKRSLPVPLFETFDMANTSMPVGRRSTTNIAPQALLLQNSDFINGQARDFATRLVGLVPGGEQADSGALVTAAFELALARSPTPTELALAVERLDLWTASFAELSSPLVFAARMPRRLDADFLAGLAPDELLYGPRQGWSYLRGEWGVPYNASLEMDRARGAGALSDVTLVDGTLRTRLRFEGDADLGALVLRGGRDGELFTGLEVLLDPREDRLVLAELGARGDGENAAPPSTLDARDYDLVAEHDYALEIVALGPRVTVSLDGETVLSTDVAGPGAPAGRLGVRAWGGDLTLDDLSVQTDDGSVGLGADPGDSPRRRALESLCLLMLNLNEFLFFD